MCLGNKAWRTHKILEVFPRTIALFLLCKKDFAKLTCYIQ
nr:MAG TPA: hypothetical protein [Caudoviricetes sp.]